MLKTKINTILLCTLFTLFFPLSAGAQYRNPILYADVPDMSVCRAVIPACPNIIALRWHAYKCQEIASAENRPVRSPTHHSKFTI